jgi:prevent-host-death family protein
MAMLVMKSVGIADLKARLSEHLDQVKAGNDIVITDRGKPVARLSRTDDDRDELDELIRTGAARGPVKPLPNDFFDMPRPTDPDGRALRAFMEERREGRWT